MATVTIDKEIIKCLPLLNLKQKKAVLNIIMAFAEGQKDVVSKPGISYETPNPSELLKLARKRKGLTLQEVEKLSGVDKSYLSRLEKELGNVGVSTLQQIVLKGLGARLEISIDFEN